MSMFILIQRRFTDEIEDFDLSGPSQDVERLKQWERNSEQQYLREYKLAIILSRTIRTVLLVAHDVANTCVTQL